MKMYARPSVTALISYSIHNWKVSLNVTSQNFNAFDLSHNKWPGIDTVASCWQLVGKQQLINLLPYAHDATWGM